MLATYTSIIAIPMSYVFLLSKNAFISFLCATYVVLLIATK